MKPGGAGGRSAAPAFALVGLLVLAQGEARAASADDPAAARLPIRNAFGVTFEQPVPESRLGASLARFDVVPDLPGNFANRALDPAPGEPPAWHMLVGLTLPKLLRDRAVTGTVMIDSAGEPLRVVAHTPARDCKADVKWLRDALDKRYSADGDAAVPPRDGYAEALRYMGSQRQIDVNCGDRLVIEYTDRRRVEAWQRHQRAVARRQEIDRRTVERHTRVRFADKFTIGGRHRLDGGFGIEFNMPWPDADPPVDELFEVVPQALPEPFGRGRFYVELNDSRAPVRIRALFDELALAQFVEALQAKYGAPMKRSRRHVVYKINGNYLSVRQLDTEVQVTLIDSAAQKSQRKRRFEEDTEGL